MKLTRGAYLTYLDASFGGTTPEWYLIGKDIEEASVDLGTDTETLKNILDETSVVDNGYEPAYEADPFYANPEDGLYPKMRDIAMNRLKNDACKTKILEVIIEDTEAAKHRAWMENVVVKPQSYGGSTEGFNIPFNINFDGGRKEGSVTMKDKVPTFSDTKVDAPSGLSENAVLSD